MPFDFDAAPCVTQDPLIINDESAALDSAYFLAVHVLEFDYTKGLAQHFIPVGYEVKGKFLFGLEVFLCFEAVSGSAQNARGLASEFVDGLFEA